MRRSELEHLIRASGEIAADNEIIIIGSQSILGQFPDAPVRLLSSMEADVYPENTNGVTGYCLEAHDLAISKLIAMRPKDLKFVQDAASQRVKIAKRRSESTLSGAQL